MPSNRVNSFAQTVDNLVEQVNIAMQSMVSLNESMTTDKDSVSVPYTITNTLTGDSSIVTYTIPSYNYTINKVNSVANSMDSFISGKGVIINKDGSTYRQIMTVPVPAIPTEITDVTPPTNFRTRNNWFFESMMFPQLIVDFDLKNKIDDNADKIYVKRVIVDNPTIIDTQWFTDNFINQSSRSYYDTITYLNANNKRYWEDEEVLDLPLVLAPYTGSFLIMDDIINSSAEEWYYLNTLNYALTTDGSLINNQQLGINSLLRYSNSIYKIIDINVSQKSIRIVPISGLDIPTINNNFEIYSDPYSEKIVSIPVGYDECNIIFLKGVNPYFSMEGSQWGDSISFWTNNLILENNTTTFAEYYSQYVSDFGRQLEGQAKEKFIPAFFGTTPNSPTISSDMFAVKQINTQLNSTLDTNSIKSTQTQIESTKTLIASLKQTISSQKSQLVELTNVAQRQDLQTKIDANINDLSKKTIEYDSLVKSLATLAYQNSAVTASPKYRVRGFFPIPDAITLDTTSNPITQQIIQFEIAYRYLRLDNTGNPLNNYSYTDPSTGQKVTGTFSEWIIVQSPIKKKTYDSSTGTYIWADENIADGESVNINQVDIAIQQGEKVELKIRSISEAGWPSNPLKSTWSDSVTIDFPSNLQGTDQVQNILSDAATEESTIKLNQTLDAAGVTVHLEDSVPNPNSANGVYFKHLSSNIEINKNIKDSTGATTSQSSMDVQSFMDNFSNNYYITINTSLGVATTTTLQKLLQEVVRVSSIDWNNL